MWGHLLAFDVEIYGTVGQWVGSVLTGLSLLLGFRILQINQQDKRREQASKILFTSMYRRDAETGLLGGIRGTIYNHSDAIILHTAITVSLKDDIVRERFSRLDRYLDPSLGRLAYHDVQPEDMIGGVVEPHDSASYDIKWPFGLSDVGVGDVKVILQFDDANGVTWNRVLHGKPIEPKDRGRAKKAVSKGVVRWRQRAFRA